MMTVKIVITFRSLMDALLMEKTCKIQGVDGRLFPTPKQFHSGCEVGWWADPGQRTELISVMRSVGIVEDYIYEAYMYD
jgi:hypothetical protein